jgi:hypothetical protein
MEKQQAVPYLGLLMVALLVESCGNEGHPGPREWTGSIDTLPSGRVLVRSPDTPAWDSTWILEEKFRLGSLDAEGPELFGQVSGIGLGPDGELYVLDGQASEVRIFGRDGEFRRAFGGEGEGPGELKGAAGLAVDSEGTLWVMNWGNARYTGFDPATGAVTREVRRLVPFVTYPWPGAFEDGTRLLDVGLNCEGQPSILRLDTGFVPKDTMPLPEPSPEDRIWFWQGSARVAALTEPFAPQPAWAPRPLGGIVLGEGAEYRVHRIGFGRDTSMTIELERERVRVTDAERDSALAFFVEMAGSLEGATADRRPRVRAAKPAHGPLFVDDVDRIWVHNVPGVGGRPAWDVFEADGRFWAQVRIPDPPDFLRPVIRGGRMAVATQVAGVPSVIVYDLVRVPR